MTCHHSSTRRAVISSPCQNMYCCHDRSSCQDMPCCHDTTMSGQVLWSVRTCLAVMTSPTRAGTAFMACRHARTCLDAATALCHDRYLRHGMSSWQGMPCCHDITHPLQALLPRHAIMLRHATTPGRVLLSWHHPARTDYVAMARHHARTCLAVMTPHR